MKPSPPFVWHALVRINIKVVQPIDSNCWKNYIWPKHAVSR